jgi:predicted phosphate transport protein (TIGR00153 family)
MTLSEYLRDRKTRRVHELLIEHAGRCRAVANSYNQLVTAWAEGNKEVLVSRAAIIRSEEHSADEVMLTIQSEVAQSNLPTKISEELLSLVKMIDKAAGAAKRSGINIELLKEYILPKEYSDKLIEASKVLIEIFETLEKALNNISNPDKVIKLCEEVDSLESKIDDKYKILKNAYFQIEKLFKSSAALIILDHSFRDLESCADYAEDAAELLLALVERK